MVSTLVASLIILFTGNGSKVKKKSNETKPGTVQAAPLKTIEEVDKEVLKDVPLSFKGTIPEEYWMHVDQLAKVIDYGVQLVGEDHMALGSDLDGGPELPREIKDISDYPQITMALQRLGYSDLRIKKILGLNWLRVIKEVTGS